MQNTDMVVEFRMLLNVWPVVHFHMLLIHISMSRDDQHQQKFAPSKR